MPRKATGTTDWRWSAELQRDCWHARYTRADKSRTPWVPLPPPWIPREDEAAAKAEAAKYAYVAKSVDKNGERVRHSVQPPQEAGVYFLQSSEPGEPVKIGVAKNIAKRVKTLQTGSASPLVLRAWMSGSHDDERRMHKKFERAHIRGEWFEPTPALEGFMTEQYERNGRRHA